MPHVTSRAWLAYFMVESLLCASGCRKTPSEAEGAAGAPQVDARADARPLALELCDVLHGFPARRKAECCGTSPQRILIDECVELVSRSVASRSLALGRDALAACSADMRRALDGCAWVIPGQPLSPPSCQRLFQGLVPAGGRCRSSLECAGSLHCDGTTPTKAGACRAPGSVGAGCGTHIDALAAVTLTRELERSHPFCAEFCALTSHKCEPLPALGARCAASVNCAPGQSCVAGVCSTAARGLRGQRCAGASCGEQLRCIDGECRALAAPGAACSSDFDCAAGGCVVGANGDKSCGPKCAISFAQLEEPNTAGMRLPLRSRD